jgi:hypothetical protein
MIAAFLLLIVFYGITQYYVRGRTQLDYEENRRKATAVAQDRLDGIRRDFTYDQLPGLDGTTKDFPVENKIYQVLHHVAPDSAFKAAQSQATTITLTVSWPEGGIETVTHPEDGDRAQGDAMRRSSGRAVHDLELMIGISLALIVVLALGRIVLASQRSWEWGRDKTVLQANVTEALEWMSRSVHAARTVEVYAHSGVNDEFRTYDETGALVHTFRRAVGVSRLQMDGADLVDRPCTRFVVTPNADSTSLTLDLELVILHGVDVQTRVAATTRATVRNRFFTF